MTKAMGWKWTVVLFAIAGSGASVRGQRVAQHEERTAVAASSALAQRVTVSLDGVSVKAALESLAAHAGVRISYRAEQVNAVPGTVTLHATGLPLDVALERVLHGTGLYAVPVLPDLVSIKVASPGVIAATGVIAGVVVDANNQRPLRGVRVRLDNDERSVLTDDEGAFRLLGVGEGSHRVAIALIGYGKQDKTVSVRDGETVSVHFALSASVNMLDQVVVTGTVIPTELKAVPNAITVITAKDIEQRGITKIDQLFRGDVPGLFAMNRGSNSPLGDVVMFSRGASALSSNSVGTNFNTNPIKTYIDGVELADPKYLSQIDPKSIERIEILTGPQASTIYGSNAINGVMQIFTKRGTTPTPQVMLNFMNGWIQNNFSSAFVPQHNYDLQLTGVEGRISYSAGGSWNYTGAWTPGQQTANTSAYGGARLEFPTVAGRLTTDLSLRRSHHQNQERGDMQQAITAVRETGWYNNFGVSGVTAPHTSALAGQTWGLTTAYSPTAWWSHEFRLGEDVSDLDSRTTGITYLPFRATTLQIANSSSDRHSLGYTTTARLPVTGLAHLSLTVGGDAWQTLSVYWGATPTSTLLGDLSSDGLSLSRTRDHNTGGFLQGQLEVVDRLFVTYGVRAEFNPAIGDKAKVLPGRYGAAYTQEFGSVTAKVRGSYGRSIRPPSPDEKLAANYDFTLPIIYGDYDRQLPNPELLPEYQQGGEGGVELYLGSRGSLVITRYNQTVDGLIDLVDKADSVRSLLPNPSFYGLTCADLYSDDGLYCLSQDANGYWYAAQKKFLNIGSIRNQGWELQSSLNIGPFTTRGTYSWTKSRVIGITPKFRASFPVSSYPQYRPGAPFQYLPEHTWAWGLTYTNAHSTVGLNLNGIGRALINADQFSIQHLSSGIRLPQNRLIVASNRTLYVNVRSGYAQANLTASHRVSTRLDGVLQVQNLLDQYHNDYDASYATIGRLTTLGLRLHL